MTLYKFILDRTCNGDTCPVLGEILSKFADIDPAIKLMALTETDDMNGHVSIQHQPRNHIVRVYIYDTDGIHETEDLTTRQVKTQPSSRVKKYTKPFPTLQSIKGRFTGIVNPRNDDNNNLAK